MSQRGGQMSHRPRGGGGQGGGGGAGRGSGGFRGDRGSGGTPGLTPENTLFRSVGNPNSSVATYEDNFIRDLNNARANKGELAIRPSYGTVGKPIKLLANFFDIHFKPEVKFYTYKVACSPEASPAWHRMEIFRKLLQVRQINDAVAATDGAQDLVTLASLGNPPPIKITVGGAGDTKEYTLTITAQEPINPYGMLKALRDTQNRAPFPTEAIPLRILNILMGALMFGDRRLAIKGKERNKILRIDNGKISSDLGGGIDCIRAFFSSVRIGSGRILLNLNVNHCTFYRHGPLVRLMDEFRKVHFNDLNTLSGYLNKCRVGVTHLPKIHENGQMVWRVKTIVGLATPKDGEKTAHPPKVPRLGATADEVEFFEEEKDASGKPTGRGAYTTVAAYFRRHHNRSTQYPNYPVVNVGNQKTKPVYLIVDVCEIPEGASFSGELATIQRQNMIRFSCRKPHENFHSIVEEGLKLIGCTDRLGRWGLKTDANMVTVPGRCLPAPQVRYAGGTAKVDKGGWNLRDQRFVQGATVKEWTGLLIHWDNEKPADHIGFLKNFHNVGRGLAVNWSAPILPHLQLAVGKGDNRAREWMRALHDLFEKQRSKVQLLVVMLPNGGDRIFDYVKWLGDVKYGLLTHCVLGSKLPRADVQYSANNAMKVNLKFGGVCQTLGNPHPVIRNGTTMVVGLDVTHPAASDVSSYPSVAAIVASTDKQLGQWPGEIRIQESRNEQVLYLKEMMLGRLQRWRDSNKGVLPSNIIIFRDGVSEGQFKMVLNKELQSVKDAVQAIYKDSQPKITVLVVGKRHNVRFYPTKSTEMSDKQNCLPGTIVDRDITRPVYWDWYLQSQAPLQGSARPAHYIVIHDEIFSTGSPTTNPSDSLQELSNTICYMMGRCTRSISYCTPAFLADRFCDRGRKYLRAYYYESKIIRDQGRDAPAPPTNSVTLNPNCRERMVYI